jgi:hypothetical protein
MTTRQLVGRAVAAVALLSATASLFVMALEAAA